MSQRTSSSNAVARTEHIHRPLSNPAVSVQADSWTSTRGTFWIAHVVFRSARYPALSVQAIIADNALDNAVVRGLVRSNRVSYATRWTTGLACAVHLRNLQVESQFNRSPEEAEVPIQAKL
ncbi:hypothetical protein B0H14DRAFT_3152470 [Mycena olivaceomarginata]|nr:hypothetical protein B0H14DRAFT_3152470 [Mycena olivaceomarginata]